MCSFQFMASTVNLNKGVNYSDTNILLNIGSTTLVFNNKTMLLNLRRSKKTIRSYLNGGYQESNLEGYFPGMFKTWYTPKSMLNILSFKDVRKNSRVATLGVRNDHKTCHMAHQTRHMVTFGRYIFNNDLMVSL